MFSLAGGFDMGDAANLPQQPNIVEKLLIANYFVFGKIFRLRPAESDSQWGLRGHVIAVPFKEPVTTQQMDPADLDAIAHVLFKGPADKWNDLKRRFRERYHVRPSVVTAWKSALGRINAYYGSFDPSPPPDVTDTLLDNATFTAPDSNNKNNPDSAPSPETDDISNCRDVEDIMLTSDPLRKPADAMRDVLESVSTAININVHPDLQKLPDEFNDMATILSNAFPWLFPFGFKNMKTNMPFTLNKQFRKWLLQFHDNRFGQDGEFLFYLFNMLQRHTACTNMAAKVRADEASIQSFSSYINDPSFKPKLKAAIANPNGRIAHEILLKLNDLIHTTSASIPFSSGTYVVRCSNHTQAHPYSS